MTRAFIYLLAFFSFSWAGCAPATQDLDPTHNDYGLRTVSEDSSEVENELTREPSQPPAPPTLEDLGNRWLYGPGLGRTAANVGTTVLFPPFALYILGNAGLQLAGYDPIYATDALPETPRETVLSFYDGITSVPGRVAALIAGRPYEEVPAMEVKDARAILQSYSSVQSYPAESNSIETYSAESFSAGGQ
jgi:hypothetical protein